MIGRKMAGLERIVRRESDESWTDVDEPRLQRWQCCRLQCCNSDGVAARNTLVATTLLLLWHCCYNAPVAAVLLLVWRCCWCDVAAAMLLLERATALLLQRCCCSVLRRYYCGTAGAVHCGAATVTVLWRCYCSDGAATLRLKFLFVFFLFDSFRRENESEKEKKERDSKLVSRLYWLA